jgi:archaellum biogenesis protein FlaJ (TadC family)
MLLGGAFLCLWFTQDKHRKQYFEHRLSQLSADDIKILNLSLVSISISLFLLAYLVLLPKWSWTQAIPIWFGLLSLAAIIVTVTMSLRHYKLQQLRKS